METILEEGETTASSKTAGITADYVITVDGDAFVDNTSITKVVLPETIESIERAFSGNKLTSFTFPYMPNTSLPKMPPKGLA